MTIDEVVGRVQLWRGKDVAVSPLTGGLTNQNFLVEANGSQYVRLPGRSTELLAIDRANEVANAKAAAEAGVGPDVLEVLPDLDVMVLAFVPGVTMSGETLRSHEMARRMAKSIRGLHSGPRFLRDFDMFRLVEYYVRVAEDHGVRVPDGYHGRLDTVAEVEMAMRVRPLPSVPCHNDLMAENYIDDGDRLWIVDYEYRPPCVLGLLGFRRPCGRLLTGATTTSASRTAGASAPCANRPSCARQCARRA